MATRKSKTTESERLDDAHISHVIAMLEAEKPWTKKECCAYLGINYNTTRLASIIDKYKEAKAKEAEMRASKRGKPATQGEIQFIVEAYLEGDTIDSISKSIYRSATFVKNILEQYHVPIRRVPADYFHPALIPDEAVREEFKVGEVVYSTRYDSLAEIMGKFKNAYRIWLISEKWKQYAYQDATELASLEHLRKLGINV